MTLVNAVMKVKCGKAPDKGRAVAATCGLLAAEAFAVGSVGLPQRESPIFKHLKWSRRSGLNGRPAVYETAALPTELRRPFRESPQLTRVFSQPQGVFRL